MELMLEVTKKEIGEISINFEELKEQLELALENYRGLVFTDDQLVLAKSEKAKLNKVKTAIDERRKSLKEEFLKPFEIVESQSKQLMGMVNTVIEEIDSQIQTFLMQEKNKKKRQIVDEIWLPLGFTLVSLNEIWDERWLNKTYEISKIKTDIEKRIETINNDLDVISSLTDDKEKANILKSKYLVRLDLKQIIHEYNQEQAAFSKLQTQNEETSSQPIQEINTHTETEIYIISFKVQGTKEKIMKLEHFLKSNNFNFEVLS